MFSRVREFKIGDYVIFRRLRSANRPSRKATRIRPSLRGESYAFVVNKYWIVDDLIDDEELVLLRTPKGKTISVSIHDPSLRHATIVERWLYRRRFPHPLPGGPQAAIRVQATRFHDYSDR